MTNSRPDDATNKKRLKQARTAEQNTMTLTDHKPALTGRALGLVLIFLTAIIWVAASFVSQLLVTNQEGRTNFHVPPFLLTYLSTSVFTVFLPLVQLKSLLRETWLLRRSFKYKPLQDDEESAPIAAAAEAAAAADADSSSPSCAGGLTADLELAEAAAAAEAASAAVRASRAAHKEALTAAAQCFLLWFVAQVLFNQSLKLTSVTSNTILSSTSSLFTFALSMAFLREPFSAAKLLSIAACMGGTLLVTLSDDSTDSSNSTSVLGSSLAAAVGATNTTSLTPGLNTTAAPTSPSSGPSHSVWGDLLCLASAAFYAAYTIVLRKVLPDDDEANVALFFGYVGLLCSVVFAPVVALLAGVGALHLRAIPSKAYLIILVQGILNYCLSDYLWAHAVLLLGPTIATLGLSVQIPVAAVVEALIGHPKWLSSGSAMAMTLSGTALIMAGFVAGNLAGGGHVYGSHHRDDAATADGHCRAPPHGPADDSFDSSGRRSPSPLTSNAAAPTNGHGSRSSPRALKSGAADAADEDGAEPQSPLLGRTTQRSHFDPDAMVVPVSTHARIRHSNGGISPHRRSSSSSPGKRPHSPLVAAGAGAGAAAGAGAGSVTVSSRPASPLSATQSQQQEPQSPKSEQEAQQPPPQRWESIELSSSFGSVGRIEQQGSSPPALAGLRPREQLPQQRSPLGLHSSSRQPGVAAAAASIQQQRVQPVQQQQQEPPP